jgi:alpha-D-xyloside xylohydrolase
MHNYYTHLYNKAVFEVLEQARGKGDAVLFARSATAGGQSMPVHWGGDSTSTFESMAETLRGGLSLAMSGFAFWSHDIGGFEGTPDPGVFKRWTAFGLLSSHSRFHGSSSYRVPWLFDEEAVDVTRLFTKTKLRLMPYLYAAGLEAARSGTPLLRPMQLEFPDDPAVGYLDRQYMLGAELLVAPVFDPEGGVEFYLPAGTWTNFFTGERVIGAVWRREIHGYDSLPLYVRDGAVIAFGAIDDRPDYDYRQGPVLRVYASSLARAGQRTVEVTSPDGERVHFEIRRSGDSIVATSTSPFGWSLAPAGGVPVAAADGRAAVTL